MVQSRFRLIGLVIVISVMAAGLFFYRFQDSFTYKIKYSHYDPKHYGVIFHDRLRASDKGYLLLNYYGGRPTCVIVDYNGVKVHEFPEGFCEFPKGGKFINITGFTTQFDGQGAIEWTTTPHFQHHDSFYDQETGETFLLGRRKKKIRSEKGIDELFYVDYLRGYNKSGQEIFDWSVDTYFPVLEKLRGGPLFVSRDPGDLPEFTHLNTLEIIPPNAYETVIPAFRRGNILVNCFLQGLVFIVDRSTKEIIWHYSLQGNYGFRGAHTVKILPNGHLFFFWNKHPVENSPQYSSVNEYDPVSKKMVWEYMQKPKESFYVPMWGGAIPLENGQFMVTDSPKGVVTQMDRDGRILWEWHTPPQGARASEIYLMTPISRDLVEQQIKIWQNVAYPLGRAVVFPDSDHNFE